MNQVDDFAYSARCQTCGSERDYATRREADFAARRMAVKPKPKLSKKEVAAIRFVLKDILVSYCNCVNTPDRSNGWQNHDRECFVHKDREHFKTLMALAAKSP